MTRAASPIGGPHCFSDALPKNCKLMPDSGPMRPKQPVHQTGPADPKRGKLISSLDLGVGLGAAILSFAAWNGLARLSGHTQSIPFVYSVYLHLSWIAPVIVDFYVMRAFRTWLGAGSWISSGTRRMAAAYSLAFVLITVGGNAAYYILSSQRAQAAPLWITVAVSVLPPLSLMAVGHLRALEDRDWTLAQQDQGQQSYAPQAETGLSSDVKELASAWVQNWTRKARPLRLVPSPQPESQTQDSVQVQQTQDPAVHPQPRLLRPHPVLPTSPETRSRLMDERLNMIKEAEPDWRERGGNISKDRIGEIVGTRSSSTQQALRSALMTEAQNVSETA